MGQMICPGQDTRFWNKSAIFEVFCGECGYSIEFFKDDASRRCPQCGARVENPNVTLGCAQWCEHAEKCLGYDPKAVQLNAEKESSLADRLIAAVKTEFGDDQPRITHALRVFEAAQELLRREEASPKVVVAAALLHDIGIQAAEEKHGSSAPRYQEQEGPPIARGILEELDLEEKTIQHVCRIVASHHSGGESDTPEFRVVWDADWLVNLPEEHADLPPEKLGALIEKTFRTDTGRELARKRFLDAQTESIDA